ncbi:uncharacterized protein LOC144638729 isoform X2 [Oculina patagonica]
MVEDIHPLSNDLKGGGLFYINLTEELPEDDKSVIAHFDGIGDVHLEKLNPFTLTRIIPANQQPGAVPITIRTQAGRLLGMTYIMYVDEKQEVLKQLVKDPALQSLYVAMWSQEHGIFGNDSNIAQNLDPLSLQDQVPPEVLTRGPVDMEIYNNALAEGKSLVKRLPLMLIGQDQAGKTSLKKSLKGISFNPEEESTVGIDADPSHFMLSKEIWKAGEKGQAASAEMAISFEHQAARFVADRLKKKETDPGEKREHVTSGKSNNPAMPTMRETPLSEPLKDPDQIQSSEDPAGWTLDDINAFTPPEQEFQEIAALAETLLQDDGLENGDVYSMLWDFAGQSVYYVTHVLFLTARAIYFLVYDLSQNPHDRAKPLMKQGVYKSFQDRSNLKTNLDYLDLWMTSVSSLASQDEDNIGPKSESLPKKLPAVFLVCTHADNPHGGRNPREMANEIFGFLKKKPYGPHLYDVFCVDNTKSGSESECPEVTRLREEVLAVSNKLPYIDEAIPIKWLKYEKALQMMLELGYKWISLDRAKYIASKVCKIGGDDETKTLLNFLHDLRILIHFDDSPELNTLVVLDPQWLIDVFKKVITVRPYHWKEKEFEDLWCKLEGEGILDENLVKHVWSDLNHQRETFEGLIAIMEKFGLLCPWPLSDGSCSKRYLVPSMLKSHPPEALVKLAASAQVPSLFVKFESGQVPSGLFPRLLLQFFQWGKEEFWRPGNPKLYHNFARFFMSGDEGCSVILQCHSSSIEVLYHSVGDNTADFSCTRVVRRQLGLILECMRNQLCWLNNMRYQMSVICPVCCEGSAVVHCDTHDVQSCKQEECLHFWSESELCGSKKSIICDRSAFAEDITVDAKVWAPWFAPPAEQVTNGKHDGRLLSSFEANEETTLALPGGSEVLESILTESCDSKEVVSRLSESLGQLSLTEPDPNGKKVVRCLARRAKHSNRLDVVQHLRDITPAGTTGPLLPESLQVRRIPYNQGRKLTISLSGRDEWKLVAENLGLTPEEILFLDKRTLNPAEAMLNHAANLHNSITVGNLYDLLVDCELPVMADIL